MNPLETNERWIRLPKPGEVCPHTGLKRGAMLNLIKARAIKAVSLRQPGRKRGNRMVWLPSVLEYFETLCERQNAEK